MNYKILFALLLVIVTNNIFSQDIDLMYLKRLLLSSNSDYSDSLLLSKGFHFENASKNIWDDGKTYNYLLYKRFVSGTNGMPDYYDAIVLIKYEKGNFWNDGVRLLSYNENLFLSIKNECTSNSDFIKKDDIIEDNCLTKCYKEKVTDYFFKICNNPQKGYKEYMLDIHYNFPPTIPIK